MRLAPGFLRVLRIVLPHVLPDRLHPFADPLVPVRSVRDDRSGYQGQRDERQDPVESLFPAAGGFEHLRRDQVDLDRRLLAAPQGHPQRHTSLLRMFLRLLGRGPDGQAGQRLRDAHLNAQLALQIGHDTAQTCPASRYDDAVHRTPARKGPKVAERTADLSDQPGQRRTEHLAHLAVALRIARGRKSTLALELLRIGEAQPKPTPNGRREIIPAKIERAREGELLFPFDHNVRRGSPHVQHGNAFPFRAEFARMLQPVVQGEGANIHRVNGAPRIFEDRQVLVDDVHLDRRHQYVVTPGLGAVENLVVQRDLV